MLQRIAHRLKNGPSPAQILPELDTWELESEMAELPRQRYTAAQGHERYELPATPISPVEFDAGPAIPPTQPANRPQGESISSRLSEEEAQDYTSGPFYELRDVHRDTEHASSSASRQVETAGQKWEGGFF